MKSLLEKFVNVMSYEKLRGQQFLDHPMAQIAIDGSMIELVEDNGYRLTEKGRELYVQYVYDDFMQYMKDNDGRTIPVSTLAAEGYHKVLGRAVNKGHVVAFYRGTTRPFYKLTLSGRDYERQTDVE